MSLILKEFLENEAAIKRFLRRFVSRAQDVEDITQETFLRAYAAEAAHEVHAPKAFLFRVARNLALNERAKLSNSATDLVGDFSDPGVLGSEDQASPEDQVDTRQRMRFLAEALETLPPQCRRVFIMRKIHGLSHKEIASRLGISVKTVEKHIATGLTKCSEYLRRQTGGAEGGIIRVVKAGREPTPAGVSGVEDRRERTGDE